MKKQLYGYTRISSNEENEKEQMIELAEYHVPEEHIFVDKQSGKNLERPEYDRMMKMLKSGDMLVVKSLLHLGHNYKEIIDQWEFITKEKHVDIVIHDIPLLDTRKTEYGPGDTFISDLVIQILSYVTTKEREEFRKRQAEGIAAAKAKGIRFGRKEKPLPANFEEIVLRWRRKEIRMEEVLKTLGVGRTYFFKHAKNIT